MLIRNISLWKLDKAKSNLQVSVEVMICDNTQWKFGAIASLLYFK